jgi:hypothetical protein
MNKIVLLIALTLFSLGVKAQKSTAGNYTYKTECLGVELDGSLTVKAWGNGRNRKDAVEQAKKNAVRDVIFFGIREGKSECDKRPLVAEVNAQDKYQDYFNKFFIDKGPYLNFISLRDERNSSKIKRDKKKARQSRTNGVIVRVLRSELRQQLIVDGIIKS